MWQSRHERALLTMFVRWIEVCRGITYNYFVEQHQSIYC
jgi:hypothetical protein